MDNRYRLNFRCPPVSEESMADVGSTETVWPLFAAAIVLILVIWSGNLDRVVSAFAF